MKRSALKDLPRMGMKMAKVVNRGKKVTYIFAELLVNDKESDACWRKKQWQMTGVMRKGAETD